MLKEEFENTAMLVTGAASGIGEATTRKMAAEGATVIAADIDVESVERVAEEARSNGHACYSLAMDVSDPAAWEIACTRLSQESGSWAALVNCAGISIAKPISDLSFAEWQKVMRVNLDGAFLGTKSAISCMQDGGNIVNVASVSGMRPFGGASAYCASKAALRMLTKSAAIECADAKNGIRVNLVSPGGVKTPMWQKESFFTELVEQHGSVAAAYEVLSGGRGSMVFCEPEDVAEAILGLITARSKTVNGVEIVLDQGNNL